MASLVEVTGFEGGKKKKSKSYTQAECLTLIAEEKLKGSDKGMAEIGFMLGRETIDLYTYKSAYDDKEYVSMSAWYSENIMQEMREAVKGA